VDVVADTLIAEIAGGFKTTEKEDSSSGSETQKDAEQGCFEIAVISFILFLSILVELVGWIQVTQKTAWAKGAANRIQDKDRDNQEGKDIIGEFRGQADVAGQVEEGRESSIAECPNAHPGIKGKERNAQRLGHVVKDGGHDQDGSGRSNNDSRHSTEEREKDTNPASSKDGLHGTNLFLGISTVHSTKSERRSNDGDEHEEGDSDSLLVEVGHLLDPVSSDSVLVNSAIKPRPHGWPGSVSCGEQRKYVSETERAKLSSDPDSLTQIMDVPMCTSPASGIKSALPTTFFLVANVISPESTEPCSLALGGILRDSLLLAGCFGGRQEARIVRATCG